MKFILFLSFLFISTSGVACVDPDGGVITVIGNVDKETFPGRPNYESIENGDTPETYWVLTLDDGICVNGLSERQTAFQLFWSLDKKRLYESGKYRISGKTMAAVTGHHHTPILIEVDRVASN